VKTVEDIFLAAVEKSPADRVAYLEEACGTDAELRAQVESLLRSHEQAGSMLDQPLFRTGQSVDQPAAEQPGMLIDSYKLIEQIGEGGMGTVWMAQQIEPVKRLVALKLIKTGMDSAQVVARFEAERQALALMDHPNIARIHDGGTTPDGRPFFVMELVKGVPLNDYCDRCSLTNRERLDLFLSVCRAVQHAHQKGVIHRDLKPSNVLVTTQDGKPAIKVIDFGIAKAINQRLSEHTLATGFHQMVGTPLYMSPEQAELSPLDVDTRTDIYSLGVLLYELLTGTTPFEQHRLKEANFDEIRRIIREEEPPQPSARLSTLRDKLSTVAMQRRTEPRQLLRTVRGELDWVVMKALEKDRNRRYDSAGAFAEDVHRYLHDEPVQAGPPSKFYRFRKFARRNKAALTIASMAIAGVLLGVAGLVVNNRLITREKEQTIAALDRAVREKERADQNLDRARQAVKQYLLQTSDSAELRAADFHDLRKKLLETAIPFYVQLVQESRDDPNLEAERAQTHYDLSQVRQEVGDPEQAVSDLVEAKSIYGRLVLADPENFTQRQHLVETHSALATTLNQLGRNDSADRAFRDAFDTLRAAAPTRAATIEYRESMARLCADRGDWLREMSRPQDAVSLFRQSVAIREESLKERPNDPALRVNLARTWSNLGVALFALRRGDEAEKAHQTAADLLDPRMLDKLSVSPDLRASWQKVRGGAFQNLSVVRGEAGRPAEALDAVRMSVSIKEQLSEQFPSVPQYRFELSGGYINLGAIHSQLKQPGEARTAYERAVQIDERLVAAAPAVPLYAVALAKAYSALGRHIGDSGALEQSLPWLTKAVDVLESHHRRDPRVADVRENLQTACWARAMTLCGLERYRQALPDWDRAIEMDDGRYQVTLRMRRASNLLNMKDHARAAADARAAAGSTKATARDLYLAAAVHAHAARLARDDVVLVEQYGAGAVALLRQAAAKGYPNPQRWTDDGDLKSLRERADFRELLDGLRVKCE
jgi:serine/threonine protein kinase/Tfp pilus assembly protein PilF